MYTGCFMKDDTKELQVDLAAEWRPERKSKDTWQRCKHWKTKLATVEETPFDSQNMFSFLSLP